METMSGIGQAQQTIKASSSRGMIGCQTSSNDSSEYQYPPTRNSVIDRFKFHRILAKARRSPGLLSAGSASSKIPAD
jgi:hypothetical protein